MKSLRGTRFGAWSLSHQILLPHLFSSVHCSVLHGRLFNALCFLFSVVWFFFGAGAGTGRFFLKLLSVNALSNLGSSARALFPLDFSVGEFIDINDDSGKVTLTSFHPVWHNLEFRAVVPPDFDTVPYPIFQEAGPAMSALFECLSSIMVCVRFVTGPCVDPVNVGAVFSFLRLPGSMLSLVRFAAICCNQRSRLRRHVGNGPELFGVALRCFPEDFDGCMAPSSRGEIRS